MPDLPRPTSPGPKSPPKRRLWALAFWVGLFLFAPEAGAQGVLDLLRGEGTQGEEALEEAPDLEQRAAVTEGRLRDVEQRLALARSEGQVALVAQLERERELLLRTKLRQDQERDAEDELTRLSEEVEALRAAVDAYLSNGSEDLAGATFFTLEAARDELDVALERADLIEKQRKAALRQEALAEGAVTTSERRERRVREAVLRAKDPPSEAAARQELRIAELAVAADVELLALRRLETRVVEKRLEQQTLEVTRARAKVERLARSVTFTQSEFRQILEEIEAWVQSLEVQKELLAEKILRVEERLAEAETKDVEARAATAESTPGETPDPKPLGPSKETQFYRQQLSLLRAQQSALVKAVERADVMRRVWMRRKQLSRSEVDPKDCVAWEAEARDALLNLEVEEDLLGTELENLRTSLQEAERERSALPVGAADSLDPTEELGQAVDSIAMRIEEIARDRRVIERLRQEIIDQTNAVPWKHRLQALWTGVLVLWETELLPLGDQSITVRKLVLGLTLFLCGIWAARRVSRLFANWLARRFEVEKGELAVAQTLSFYLLVLVFFLIALRVVNVPLTAFTIFGGAIAIGVGFGSQNLVNNFISGLIILMEQPIRVGDLIQVGDLQGNVEHIGARSTVVRTGSNIEIVVPNSTFLEQQVVNLTLSESKVRVFVRVGVAYGSPTREVARLLRRAVEEHGRVLKSPEAIVLFEDFGDDALIFEVHFWIRMRMVMDRRTIESDVRFIIDGVFRDAGITIAYPQRDIHLDTTKALDVRVVSEESQPRSVAEAKAAAMAQTKGQSKGQSKSGGLDS